MTRWLRRTYDSIGLTQYAPGPHLGAVQDTLRSSVVLCLDVSGSMAIDKRIPEAISGSRLFVDEALACRFDVGVVVFSATDVEGVLGLTADRAALLEYIDDLGGQRAGMDRLRADERYLQWLRNPVGADPAQTDLAPAVVRALKLLADRPNTRVIAVFTDGEIAHPGKVANAIQHATEIHIDVIICALEADRPAGNRDTLAGVQIQTASADGNGIRDAISGMAGSLKQQT